MPRACSVCAHPQRRLIDQALADGKAIAAIAATYRGVSEDALGRHKAAHLVSPPTAIAVAGDSADRVARIEAPGSVHDQLEELTRRTRALLDRAEQAGELRTALMAVKELRAQLENIVSAAAVLASAAEVQLFQKTVLDTIGATDSPTRARVIAALHQARAQMGHLPQETVIRVEYAYDDRE